MKSAMQELWEYIEANYHEEGFNILDAKQSSLELEKQQMDISDEEIDKNAPIGNLNIEMGFIRGAKWYREKLKQINDKTNG